MEIVVEIQQKVAAAAEEIYPNLPWEEFDGKMQSVVEVYTEVEATIIRTTSSRRIRKRTRRSRRASEN